MRASVNEETIYLTLLLEEFENFPEVILKYTIIMSTVSAIESELESKFFNAGVGVWSPKISNPGVRVGSYKNKDSGSLLQKLHVV